MAAHLTADCVVSAEKTAEQAPPPVAAADVAAGTFLHFEEVSKEEGSRRSPSTREEVEGRGFDCERLRSTPIGRLWQWRELKVLVAVPAADVVQ